MQFVNLNIVILYPENVYYLIMFHIINLYKTNKKLKSLFSSLNFTNDTFFCSIKQNIHYNTVKTSKHKKYLQLYKSCLSTEKMDKFPTNIYKNVTNILLSKKNINEWKELIKILQFWNNKLKNDNINTSTKNFVNIWKFQNFNLTRTIEKLKLYLKNLNDHNVLNYSGGSFTGVLNIVEHLQNDFEIDTGKERILIKHNLETINNTNRSLEICHSTAIRKYCLEYKIDQKKIAPTFMRVITKVDCIKKC